MDQSRLFTPVQLGAVTLQHRIAMAPLTRFRATLDHVPTPAMAEYYGQRASVAGTLLVSEGTFVSPMQGGYARVPGIWSDAQVAGWRAVTDAVHAKGSVIFCQLWALGRVADPAELAKDGHVLLGPSAVPAAPAGAATPAAMSEAQIQATIAQFVTAARNAVAAGFDGVELHGANGYLLDQFLQDVSNTRTDAWGGSVAKRSRFVAELAAAVAAAVGAARVGIRFSPWSTFQGMLMADPVPQFTDVLTRLQPLGLAYVHAVESRVHANDDVAATGTLDFVYQAWDGPLLIAGGYTPASAQALVDAAHPERDVVVVFGRHFISTPDLPFRVRKGIPLNAYDRATFYDWTSVEGYTGQPFSAEFLASQAAA